MTQATYAQILESRVFESQAEAADWAKEIKTQYNQSGNPVKTDVVPVDATRRRWKAIVYLKA